MLSAPEADIVRRDSALPGLATVLDPEALVAALRSHLPPVTAARTTYLRYKPGRSCLVAYRLDTEGGVDLYAKTGPARAPGEPGCAVGPWSGPEAQGRIILRDGTVAVCFFPADHKLKALHRLADAELRRRLLRKLVPDASDLWDGTIDRLRYLPERRYVARALKCDRPFAVLKLYSEREYDLARRNVNAFRSQAPFRAARCLGMSDRRRILVHEWLIGRVLGEAVSDPEPDIEALRPVGAALARLHAQDPPGLLPLTREVEAVTLFALSAHLGFVLPRLAARLHRLVQRLAEAIAQAPPMNRPIHGDFCASQVLLAGDHVTILDFDRAARGNPAVDLGSFIAHLESKALRGELSASRVEPLRQAFQDGYRRAMHDSVPARVPLYTAVGLVRLAAHPIRDRDPDWPALTERLVERAAAVADGGDRTVPRPVAAG